MSEGSTGVGGLLEDVEEQAARLDRELEEIDLLAQQARAEASRHELRRSQAKDRLTALDARRDVTVADYREATTQVLTMTGRAALMESQVSILEGKQRSLIRYRESLERIRGSLSSGGASSAAGWTTSGGAIALGSGVGADGHALSAASGEPGPLPPALARAILSAQEDLRRDIARAMHDGPAQSLTNIVLQAEIAHRLMARDPKAAAEEVAQLVRMVQHALDATKSFIFDVRPMVLDDLGLVPTLRRAALDRGSRASVPIHFESIGQDRRLAQDLESGIFRILDDALVGYLSTHPPAVHIEIDWTDDQVRSLVRSDWPDDVLADAGQAEATPKQQGRSRLGRRRDVAPVELPPALAAMMREQQDDAATATQAAADAVTGARALPEATWREIERRADTLGVEVTLSEEGRALELTVPLPVEREA